MKVLRLLESRLVFFLACFLFRCLLDVAYIFFVNPVFAYSGFGYEFSLVSYVSSWLFYIPAVLLTPHFLTKVSDYFLASFLLTIMAPLSSLFGLTGNGIFSLFVTFLVFIFFKIFQHGTVLSRIIMPVPRVKKIKDGWRLSLIIALVSVLILVVWYFYSGAFRYFNLDLVKVYEFRADSAELANVGFFSYFNGWVYNVFSIFLMCHFLCKRRFLFFSILLGVQFFFFGVSAHKAVLFYPIMILGLWFYFRRAKSMLVMPLGFSFIVVVCLILYVFFDHVLAGSLFVRRVFFVPAILTLDYFSFFSLNDFVWWSNSILSGFVSYPYDERVALVIGEYNGSGASANNGFISSGYAHAGLIGVAVYTFLLTYFIKVLDVFISDSDVPVWLGLCMTIIPLRSALISADLFTTMLTHGLALSLVMVFLYRRSSYTNKGNAHA